MASLSAGQITTIHPHPGRTPLAGELSSSAVFPDPGAESTVSTKQPAAAKRSRLRSPLRPLCGQQLWAGAGRCGWRSAGAVEHMGPVWSSASPVWTGSRGVAANGP